jgi:dipeptidyl aminopeptidase/acylaminoacyl peptidase
LIYGNCRYSSIVKAIGTDVYSFIMERVDASPSVWLKVGSKPPQLITSTNPQQKNYYWTRSEMIQYRNRKGKPLHGALFYPANYKPGKKYPLVVHVYERLSQYLHHYVQPENVSYGVFNFTQGDYFIFTPDISFEIDNPGMSAVDCVVPAVEQVIKNEGVDKGRLGLMGHSWGGYLTTFIISQTDLFKAAVAGAPPTDLVSLSLSLRWENGSTNQLFEGGQARFSGPFYDRQEAYIRNSSVYQSKNIHTPLLLAFGDKDGFVDWRQGIELYNALRRQKKSCLFLYYQGSGHQNLPEDYATKQIEFFNHYLKGKQAPEWMGWADK